jgi:general secretion pathway protein G
MSRRSRSGFSVPELTAVVTIVALLAGVVIPRVNRRIAAGRDSDRLADVQTIRAAIERYYADHGEYPPARGSASFGGWDVSHDGDFIPELVGSGYLSHAPADPRNDDLYQYRYYVYRQGSYGCVGPGSYYVLGIKRFETEAYRQRSPGYLKCVERDWNEEFAFVTGGGASYQ